MYVSFRSREWYAPLQLKPASLRHFLEQPSLSNRLLSSHSSVLQRERMIIIVNIFLVTFLMNSNEVHRPLYETIPTVGLPMCVDKRWRGIAEEAICFHLDCVLVLDSLNNRAEEVQKRNYIIYYSILL